MLIWYHRNDTPSNLVKKQGIFWEMLRNTGEYDELIQMIDGGDGSVLG